MFDDSGCPPEADLCEELGVSHGSPREAVRKLAALGVVEPRHGSGTYVSPPRPEDLIGSLSLTLQLLPPPGLLEPYEIRRVLEAHVAAQADAHAGAAGATKPPAMTPPCPRPLRARGPEGQPDVRAAGAVRSACTDLDPPARSPAPTWTLRRSAGWSPPARAPWSGPRKGTERYGGTGASVSASATRTLPRVP